MAQAWKTPNDVVDALIAALHGSTEPVPSHLAQGDEGHDAMVAIAAAAFALDGLYGTIRPLVSVTFTKARRSRRIFEVIKTGFVLGKRTRQLSSDIDWVFRTRDAIVHHTEAPRPVASIQVTERSQVYGAPELVYLNAEAANRAALIAETVFITCADNPKMATKEWARRARYLAWTRDTRIALDARTDGETESLQASNPP